MTGTSKSQVHDDITESEVVRNRTDDNGEGDETPEDYEDSVRFRTDDALTPHPEPITKSGAETSNAVKDAEKKKRQRTQKEQKQEEQRQLNQELVKQAAPLSAARA